MNNTLRRELAAFSSAMTIVGLFIGYKAVNHQGLTMRNYKNKTPQLIQSVSRRLPKIGFQILPFVLE